MASEGSFSTTGLGKSFALLTISGSALSHSIAMMWQRMSYAGVGVAAAVALAVAWLGWDPVPDRSAAQLWMEMEQEDSVV